MDSTILIAVISAATALAVSAVTAGLTYVFTKRREREADWRKMKLDLYKEYVEALTIQCHDTSGVQASYAQATNAVTLVATTEVLKAVYAFNDSLGTRDSENLSKSIEMMLAALRRDMQPSRWHKSESFAPRLFLAPPVLAANPSTTAESP